MGLVIIAYN